MYDLQNWINDFLKNIVNSNTYAKNTYLAYRRDLYQFFEKTKKIDHKKDISLAQNLMQRALWVQKNVWNRLKPSSQQRKLAALKTFFLYLEKRHLIDEPIYHYLHGP
ncbi:MAG: site-specific integrase, partial [Bdellovibrionaceae bacterium]|nr:site-specific integrase [Pseudobdellovibrionaceae bacterium]MDW8191202.1 site-specific integrase [Pseudobdellovibrionaceae bacterium]